MLLPTIPLFIEFDDFQFLLTGHHGGSVPQTPTIESLPPMPNLDPLRKLKLGTYLDCLRISLPIKQILKQYKYLLERYRQYRLHNRDLRHIKLQPKRGEIFTKSS